MHSALYDIVIDVLNPDSSLRHITSLNLTTVCSDYTDHVIIDSLTLARQSFHVCGLAQ